MEFRNVVCSVAIVASLVTVNSVQGTPTCTPPCAAVNGTCITYEGTNLCSCARCWTGPTCAQEITRAPCGGRPLGIKSSANITCDNDPCRNSGYCQLDSSDERGYSCVCLNNRKGLFCEEIEQPPRNPCTRLVDPVTCVEGKTCTTRSDMIGHMCV